MCQILTMSKSAFLSCKIDRDSGYVKHNYICGCFVIMMYNYFQISRSNPNDKFALHNYWRKAYSEMPSSYVYTVYGICTRNRNIRYESYEILKSTYNRHVFSVAFINSTINEPLQLQNNGSAIRWHFP